MIETKLALDANANITLDSTGNGIAFLGPTYPGERWSVSLFSARGTSSAKLEIFRGTSMSKLDGTNRADNDTSNTDISLMAGESLRFVWTNGTTGASMQCTVQGDRYIPGRRAY